MFYFVEISNMWYVLVVTVAVIILALSAFRRRSEQSLSGKHIMVTGGSSGIGLAVAVEAAARGASVSLIARNEERLTAAKKMLESCALNSSQKFSSYSVDLSHDIDAIQEVVNQAENELGPIFMLVNCAGTSVCYRFEEIPVQQLEKMMNANFYGSVHITRAVLPLMKNRQEGKIVFTSSIAGLFGLYGYSAYSASKFALVGMAEALAMEVKPYNISITVSYPPDTDTPGFAEEIKTKLDETKLVSEAGGLVAAKDVAQKTLADAMNNRFMSTYGFAGWAIGATCCGLMPATFLEVVCQALTMGCFRLILWLYLQLCDRAVKKCAIEKLTKASSAKH